MVDTGKITIDDRGLLEKAVRNLQRNENAQAEMPAHLSSSHIPTKEVLKPSTRTADPLRTTKLYRNSKAVFKMPRTASSHIFRLHIAPNIGDKEEIENYEKQVNQTKAAPAKEKAIILQLLKTLKEKEKDFEEIANRLKEFVLG